MADVIAVSALNKYVRSILESDPVLTDIAIQGEISNFTRNYKTGHCYFSLKDDKASVKAVMFRSDADRLAFTPENGMRVVARGRISLYERDGAFQIYVEFLFPDGVGAAQLAFEQLKERLNKEGLFAEEIKKSLPEYPACIGLVTSKTGAALQDILRVAQRRCPLASFLLAPVSVQGQNAVPEICEAIQRLDDGGQVDLIIVARGGGSKEDLWVFNDEAIARTVFACGVPVISAIGHEIDFTILDFVADLRAATPTAAAEIALPDMAVVLGQMMHICLNISNNIQFRVDSWYNAVRGFSGHPGLVIYKEKIPRNRQRLEELQRAIQQLMTSKLSICQHKMQNTASLAAGLNPYSVLARGYGVVKAGEHVITQANEVKVGQHLDVILTQGSLACEVLKINNKRVTLE